MLRVRRDGRRHRPSPSSPSSLRHSGSRARAPGEQDCVRASARPDLLHEREPVVAEQRPQSREELGLLHGLRRPRLRDAVPLRPAEGQVHPVARDGRQVEDEDDVRHDDPKGVKWSDGKPMTPADVKYSFDLAKMRDASAAPALGGRPGCRARRSRATRRLHVRGKPGLPAVRLLPLQRRDRPAAHLHELQARPRSRPATSDTKKIVGTGPYAYQSGAARRRRRSSGRSGTTGGPRRRSG